MSSDEFTETKTREQTEPTNGEELKAVSKSVDFRKLTWYKFKKNKTAIASGIILIIIYFVCFAFPEFFAPYNVPYQSRYFGAPPQIPRYFDREGNFSLRPFVYGYKKKRDLENFRIYFEVDTSKKYSVYFFTKGEPYKLWGLFPGDIHFFNTKEGGIFLFGTDSVGGDLFSRILYGGRISLSIGLAGVFLSLLFGVTLGTASGYFGGITDIIMQRFNELIMCFPHIPLWMALSTAVPVTMSPYLVYFGITIILSFISWGPLGRQIRGMVFSLREQDFVLAARSFGASDWRIIRRHLIPNVMSHIIVIATLSIPFMILGETALSFLGLGLRPPMTSWGVLLKEVQKVYALRFSPWQIIPVFFVVTTVLAYNFLGDGFRDAADPFSRR